MTAYYNEIDPYAAQWLRNLSHAAGGGQRKLGDAAQPRRSGHPDGTSITGELGDADSVQRQQPPRQWPAPGQTEGGRAFGQSTGSSPVGGFWSDAEWIACTDGKARPVGPGSFPLGHGIQRRTSKLRAYGNAIVPQVAAEFIKAVA